MFINEPKINGRQVNEDENNRIYKAYRLDDVRCKRKW